MVGFTMSPSDGIFHAIHIPFQFLNTGGLFPHQSDHFGEPVEVGLRVELHSGGYHVSYGQEERVVSHQILLVVSDA